MSSATEASETRYIDALGEGMALALEEDLGLGDVTSRVTVGENKMGDGTLLAKETLVLVRLGGGAASATLEHAESPGEPHERRVSPYVCQPRRRRAGTRAGPRARQAG